MHTKNWIASGLVFVLTCSFFSLAASDIGLPKGALKKAKVISVNGEVTIREDAEAEPEAAEVGAVVKSKRILHSAKKSCAELEFVDMSIARIGANTVFTFDRESRTLRLKQGTALIQVYDPKGGCKVVTPAATAAVLGTTVVVDVKPRVNEGFYLMETAKPAGLQLFSAGGGARSTVLKPGECATTRPGQGGFFVKPFDVPQLWNSHECGRAMGPLRNGVDVTVVGGGAGGKSEDKEEEKKDALGDKKDGDKQVGKDAATQAAQQSAQAAAQGAAQAAKTAAQAAGRPPTTPAGGGCGGCTPPPCPPCSPPPCGPCK
ncbi:MAG: FecR domain-containing protein [Verrucomicrobiae bacterium]|nr:FecR domain-containing protein [Verrucomicrobiae bacterium]